MNRTVVMGLAIFFALVGIALMGGESKAVAGHGCHGCGGGHGCDGGGCHGPISDCCGVPTDCCGAAHHCGGRRHHRARRHRCHGRNHCGGYNGCAGYHNGCGGYHGGCGGYDCGGGYPVEQGTPADMGGEEAAPAAASAPGRTVFRTASFRR